MFLSLFIVPKFNGGIEENNSSDSGRINGVCSTQGGIV